MRLAFLQPITSFMIVMTCLVGYSPSVQGVNFEQQELEQSQVIAIARPYGNNKYDLLILQQIPGKKQCWSESGSSPVMIEPLLLNFDFTGSCERSTDANGYSIRIDGQDYGMDYLLRVVVQNKELLLIGTSRNNSKKTDVIVGRTNGIAPGLLKISLNPGWRFSKRVYQGQTLGHVYLTGDSQAIESVNILNATNPTPQASSSSSSHPPKELTFTAEGTKPQPPATSTLPQKSSSQPLPPPPLPPLPKTNNSQPLPPPPLPPLPKTNNSQPLPPPSPSVATATTNSSSRKTLSDTLSSLSGTSTPAVAQASPQRRYKVVVAANNNEQKSQVRSLYPDSFPTSYQGSSVWQIGVFSNQDKAQQALQSLASTGIKGQIIGVP